MTLRHRALKGAMIATKLAWLSSCVYLLLLGVATLKHPEDPNNIYGVVIFHGGMRVLTFPLGVVAWYLLYGILALTGPPNPGAQLWVFWVPLMIVGYLQWFKLVPMIFDHFWESRRRVDLDLGS
jgi:hypothetical protein